MNGISFVVFKTIQQWHDFPGTAAWLSLIIHRPHSEQFLSELLSTKEIVLLKRLLGEVCGLFRMTGTVFLDRDAVYHKQNSNQLHCIGSEAEIPETDNQTKTICIARCQ